MTVSEFYQHPIDEIKYSLILFWKRKVLLQSCYIHILYDFLTFEIMAKSVYSTKLIGDTHSHMIINVFSIKILVLYTHQKNALLLRKNHPCSKLSESRNSVTYYIFFIGLFWHIFCLKYVQLSFWGFTSKK